MDIRSITVDTCVWNKYIDGKPEKVEIQKMFDVCLREGVEIHASSRVFSFDTTTQNAIQTESIKNLMDQLGAKVTPAPFIFGSIHDPKNTGSAFGREDFFGSCFTSEAEDKFIEFVGQHPSKLNPAQLGKKASNHIGDYDALERHFINNYGAFITYDTHLYFTLEKREVYKKELNLFILSPSEFISLIGKI
ncbi:hypothetical protein [Plesiomonas shigelloides]|uniref:hypothetical protein n=1 Tax=Plesiomonas shigelloides TaxID=703 RepID=UPI001E2A0F0C|nr:hypothetical protein [Plesiomonas shigelloides]